MSLGIGLDPNASGLLTAIGIIDDNGQLLESWFNDPLGAVGRVFSNPVQRAAFLHLLDDLLPAGATTPGWHPLLDHELGNLYLTVEGDLIGVAADLRSPPLGTPVAEVRGSVQLPLLDAAGQLRPIAATPDGPIRIGVDVEFADAELPLTGVSAEVTVDIENGAGVIITLRGVRLGTADPTDLVIDSASIGADLLGALRVLLKSVVDALAHSAGADAQLGRLADHLFDLLGIDPTDAIEEFPLQQVFQQPQAALDWLVDIVDSPATLTAWATHLAGLIGADLPVAGSATATDPFRAELLHSDALELDLIIDVTADRELEIGLDATANTGPVAGSTVAVALSATATVLRIPLPPLPGQTIDPAAPARVMQLVPHVAVGLVAPPSGTLIDDGPTVIVGSIGAGFQLVDGQIQPWLRAGGVTLEGVDHGDVDLTDADAVIGLAADAATQALEQAFGDNQIARALLTLIGLRKPDDDPTTPHLLDAGQLGRSPTTALATFHRELLADAGHSWSHLFSQIAALVGLPDPVTGSGTPADPWTVPVTTSGPATFALAAWNARTATDPDGLQRLRLGLRVNAVQGGFTGGLLIELLGFDLPTAGPGTVTAIGRSQLTVQLTVPGPLDLSGVQITSGPFSGLLSWQPGTSPVWRFGVTGVTLTIDPQSATPQTYRLYDLTFPGTADDLGLGRDAIAVLGRLLSSALRSWAGDTAYAITALLGLHRDLPNLPADWPLLSEVLTDADSFHTLLADPAAALRSYLSRVASGVSATGRSYLSDLLQLLGGLLPGGFQPLLAAPTGPSALDVSALDLSALRSITGSGRYDDPWVISIIDHDQQTPGDADQAVTGVEVLVWLDPDGPPAAWISAIAQLADTVTDGAGLAGFLTAAAAFRPELTTLLDGRDAGRLATAFGGLSSWLTTGDGLVPLASQLPSGWAHGTVVAAAHTLLPKDPGVISQLTSRLAGGTNPVLLITPPFADHTLWSELITAITGAAQPDGTHFDLRSLPDPTDVDLTTITANAGVYTVDLLADVALSEVDQLQRVVERVQTITGHPVRLIGHSTAGVIARSWAAAHSGLATDLITLGTPHSGSDLGPLTDAVQSEAVRLGSAVAGPIADSLLGGALTQLGQLLDGVGGPLGGAIKPEWFTGVAAGLVDPPFADHGTGLAIGSQLSGDLFGLLSGATVTGLSAGDPPTHLAFGVRLRLATPAPTDGEIAVGADARIDLCRLKLSGTAPDPARPATAIAVNVELSRPGGWLVGQGQLPAGPITARIRAVRAGVLISSPGGTLDVQPSLRLVDAAVDAGQLTSLLQLGDAELRAALDALSSELAAVTGQPVVAAALDLLRACGAVIDTSAGPRASIQGLTDLATVPIRTLSDHRAALLTALAGLLSLPAGGVLQVGLPELPIRLSLDDTQLRVRLETTSDLTLAGPLTAGWQLDLDTRTLAVGLTARLTAGPVSLQRTADGRISVSATPWLPELTLRPYDPSALRDQLTGLLPDLSVSAIAGAILDRFAGGPVTIPPVNALVHDPIGWLTGTDMFGNSSGQLDGDKINATLIKIATALSLDGSTGLGLPGGFLLRTTGTDPLHIALSGSISEPAEQLTTTIALALDRSTAGAFTPAGSIALQIALPGSWGNLTITFTADASGVGLLITPANTDPIRLLPTVSGLGNLLSSAVTALVPKVLQEITDSVQAAASHPVLDVVLQIAEALGIYASGTGFTGTTQAQRLASMLNPDWLRAQTSDPGAIVDLLAGLFPDSGGHGGVITLPAGQQIIRNGNNLRWQATLPGTGAPDIQLGAELGWAAAGHPQAMITVDGLDTGPVTIVTARLGYSDDLEGTVRLRVDVGDPLAFFTPELEFSMVAGSDGVRVGIRILPLGDAAATDAQIVLLPQPSVTLTTAGGLELAGQWLLPILTHYLLPQLLTLLEHPLWSGGPSTRQILASAGLVTSSTGDLQIPTTFPAIPRIALGALQAGLAGVTIQLTPSLALSTVQDPTSQRFGLRLHGSAAINGDDVSVTLLFGEQDWIGSDAGVTAWMIAPAAAGALVPVVLDPGIEVAGLGLQISGSDNSPLVGGQGADGGPIRLGRIGAMIFLNLDFLDHGQATFAVDGFGAAVELIDAAVQVDGGDGDAFVSKIIPTELAAGFSVAVAYRDDHLEVHGGPGDLQNGIALTFPLNLNVADVIFLRELYLAGVFGNTSTDVIAALSGNATLGPLAITVDRVGLRVTISSAGGRLSFKPPDGFGLSLDTSAITLGGFLLVDEARGRYVGALEISLLKKFQLTAIGIVTTKRPDGTPGFSLLMLITVSLPVPIPLGYGFFFAGAGGLLGLNRGMDVDRIRDGLRTGTADSILFPTDVVNRIDVIVRDLEQSFPFDDGHFLIAPMGMIQWMNPALVTLKVGIVLEIAPQPNVALLGVLRMALPTADEAVVDLKVAFLGGIDTSASLLYFDAAIYDSFIGYGDFKISFEGDIAIRLCWGSSPDLVASIGGFHPSYRPAANLKLPAMRRITLSLLKDNPRLTLKLYFAVTSNTVQFGAALDFYAGVSGFAITGSLGFDVLVQFAPFLIDAHMWGKLAVTAGDTDICSISLDLQLRGPTPWYAHGTASISILFFSISVDVEATFGQAHETSIPGEPVLPKVLCQLSDPLNWVAELSAAASAGITLLPMPTDQLVVDAGGLLSARQNLVPLETDIGLVGKTPPSDVSRITISALTFGTGSTAEAVGFDDVTAPFAPSTFAGASSQSADLLKAPSFEQRPNGIRAIDGEHLGADFTLDYQQTYEMIIIDDPDADTTPPPTPATPRLAFSRLISGGAIGLSAGAQAQRRLAERGKVVAARAAEPLFAVTTTDSLLGLNAGGLPDTTSAVLLSRTDAEQRLAGLAATPGTRFQIVPEAQIVQ